MFTVQYFHFSFNFIDTTMVKTIDNSKVSNVVKVHEQLKKLKYVCEICGNTFTRQSNLIVHQKIHTLQKEYVCNICNKAFIQKTNLKNHQHSIHIDERPHRCDICDKSFSIKSLLNKHRLIHTGERPYKCGHCKKSFLSSSHRTKHIRSVHDKIVGKLWIDLLV
ncbi:zinc finger protein 616-like [Aphis craccivora]|uniref:Zinc finger protein 616-like n=1 Tax=Aphis craccivora TaxID=307492 RepID=A0A6G0YCD6_APHCR|nr:zinc finger protein 616-like [Aphis craccivora]